MNDENAPAKDSSIGGGQDLHKSNGHPAKDLSNSRRQDADADKETKFEEEKDDDKKIAIRKIAVKGLKTQHCTIVKDLKL